ncbi:ATP-grasp domain-containing protein [Salinispora arenicola]|uniref:ATP-grasp domain-containing protein n=1 Tax=Salinispora arenicola TaxID=168697 RepID=UPI000365320A|nr:hypothetical protein [Salinispora arenicola]
MKKLAVVYNKGAVHPMEVYNGLSGTVSLVFAVSPAPAARRLVPVMERIGEVVALTGDHGANASALADHRPDGIVTFSESMLPTTSALADSLGLRHHDAATVERLTDKHTQRTALRRADIDTTAQRLLRGEEDWETALADIGLPAVLKPAWGGGSRDTHRVDDGETGGRLLRTLLSRNPSTAGFVLEELLSGSPDSSFGDYVSVESLVLDSEPHHLAVTGKFPLAPPFRETGQFWPADLGDGLRHDVLKLTTDAVRALGVTSGITHTEIKLTACGPRIIEVNGRLGGHVNELSLRACGVDVVRLAGLAALGEPVSPPRLVPDRVFWQYNNPAPTSPCRLVAVNGWREACTVPGVSRYTPYARVTDLLDGGVMTQALDLVSGEATSHAAMRKQLAQVMDLVSFTFDFEGETRTVPASALAAH